MPSAARGTPLSHFILVMLHNLTQFSLKVDINLNVQVSDVPGVGLESEHAEDLLPLGAGEVVLQVEHGLLPVGVRSVWGRGESNSFVTVSEFNVEKCHQGLNIVISSDLQVERRFEGDVFLLDGLDINLFDQTLVTDNLVPVHHVHDGFCQGDLPDGGHVEAVDVVPPVDLVVLVLPVLDGGDVERGSVGEHQTPGLEPLVPGEEDRVEHGLVEEAVAHPLGDDDVHLLNTIWQGYLLHLTTKYLYFIR